MSSVTSVNCDIADNVCLTFVCSDGTDCEISLSE